MTSGADLRRPRRRALSALRWPLRLFGARRRRMQRRIDRVFWGLIHDHNWLQYEPPRERK